MKISVKKMNKINDVMFENKAVFIDGVKIGVVGLAHLEARSYNFFHHLSRFKHLESVSFSSASELKAMIEAEAEL
jgi:hypothetical protein